ncbi:MULTISPECIES: hypothetical protein [unclassified Rahnella]|uniref:hypothetical protein n=1 Tax=unclassified Rahnella TaxID=2635087 RepID=UPI001F10B743|nr:hypothetical protein [Rahnella sp. CFA14(1/10)]
MFDGEVTYWQDIGLSAYKNKSIQDGQDAGLSAQEMIKRLEAMIAESENGK